MFLISKLSLYSMRKSGGGGVLQPILTKDRQVLCCSALSTILRTSTIVDLSRGLTRLLYWQKSCGDLGRADYDTV